MSRRRQGRQAAERKRVGSAGPERLAESGLGNRIPRRVDADARELELGVPVRRLGLRAERTRARSRVLPVHAAEKEGGGGDCRHRPCRQKTFRAHPQWCPCSYPWCGWATYGNVVRNVSSFWSTPSPSRLFGVRFALPLQKPKLST